MEIRLLPPSAVIRFSAGGWYLIAGLLAAVTTIGTPAQSNSYPPSHFPASAAFARWIREQRTAGSRAFTDPQLLAAGLSLARERSEEMRRLLATDPEEFVRRALPSHEREQLPPQLQPFIEQRIKARGSFAVFCAGFKPDEPADAKPPHPVKGLAYEVQINGLSYPAHVFGKWRDQKTVREAAIEGVILGREIAVGDSPTPKEQEVAGELVTADTPTTTGPNTLLYIIARFSDETSDPIADATALSHMTVVSNFWMQNSSGTVSLRGLVNPNQVMDIVHITLPQPRSYAATYNANFGLLLSDARSAAAAQGFNYASYNLDLLVTIGSGFSYAGRAYIGGQGAHCVAGYTTLRTSGHELGHNLGLYHANYWRTDNTRPNGRDAVPGGYTGDTSNAERVEYGHYFSVMSAQSSGEMGDAAKPHYAAVEKVDLGWLSGSEVQYVSGSGTYRLYRHDHGSTVGTPRAIRIETAASDYTGYSRRYWLNYRCAPWATGSSWLRNGIQVDVCQSSYGGDGAIQLDMTPYSNDDSAGASYTDDNSDKLDGALIVGRTYSDTTAGIHITPMATSSNGVNEEYIDLVVNLGTFPANLRPVITAFTVSTNRVAANQAVNFAVTATDADGDTLAYSWEFDQGQVWTQSGLNSATAIKSWPGAGQYRVVVTVSDRKGGIATESAIITVGSPVNNRQVWGRVLWGGTPVYGARVSTTTGNQAWTESDGTFVLTDLAASSYTLKCQRDGLTFSTQFANPISVAAGDVFGQDFYANESLPGGGGANAYTVAGQVTYGGAGVSGAEVRAGGLVVTTDAGGNYQFTNFPPGNYTLAPRKDNWTFSPATRAITVSSANSSGNNFSRVAPYAISGRVDGPGTAGSSPAPTVYLSNGQSVSATKQGSGGNRYWGYTLDAVPAGQFSVSAELSGYLIAPTGFSNPLTVGGNLTTINFNGSSTANNFGVISGRITERGLPLSGATIAAQAGGVTVASGLSDSDGYYRVANLTNGTYTVVASKSGYIVSPAAINVGNVSASGQNFTATGAALPAVVSSFSTTPSIVPNVTSTTTLAAAATGLGPLQFSWDALAAPGPVGFSTNDSLAATTVASFQSPGSYTLRVRVTDGNGFTTTATTALTVNAGPSSMAVTPFEVLVTEGQSVAFRADAWDELGNEISATPQWSVSSGGTINASGLFAATTSGGPYQVSAVAGSLAATGTVWVLALVEAPPSIVIHPQSQPVALGSNVTFTVLANGTLPLSYQWLGNGTNITGATSNNFTLLNAQLTDAGNYSVQITNSAGQATSSNAVLTVIEPPVITSQPASQTLALGSNVTFAVLATGTEPLAYQWRQDGAPLAGATSNSFTRPGVQPADAGLYSVQVSNFAGVAISSNALLTVVEPPAITTEPVNQAVAVGSNFTFAVSATGTAPFAYQWQLNGTNLLGATTDAFTQLGAEPAHAGNYTVTISNLAGMALSAPATLSVNRFPVVNPLADQTIHAGSTLVLTNSAFDPDAPPQQLTFSLLTGAPASATIDATNGVFAWSPLLTEAGTTNPIAVHVTDDGLPSLSDTKSFVIRVVAPLLIESITASNTTVTIRWTTIPGRTYRVEYRNDLGAGGWTPILPDVPATGPSAGATDGSSGSERYYRVMLVE